MQKLLGLCFINIFNATERFRGRIFSLLISGGFAQFGKNSIIVPPFRFAGINRMEIGSNIYIGRNSWIQTLPDSKCNEIALKIGDFTRISQTCVISAVRSIVLEDNVLVASNVLITDHRHRYEDTRVPINDQNICKISPVNIGKGAWIGQNVVICPGVTVGKGAVIGANSVVKMDVPEYCVAAGIPARIIKSIKK